MVAQKAQHPYLARIVYQRFGYIGLGYDDPCGTRFSDSKTKPPVSDTDIDGLPDGLEVTKYRTNPTVADTDGDGVKDGDEVFKGTDPMKHE